MKRVILSTLFILLGTCLAGWAEQPEFIIETPSGWVEHTRSLGPNVVKRLIPQDNMASVTVHTTAMQGGVPVVSVFADTFEESSMNDSEWEGLTRVQDFTGQTAGGVPMLMREYTGKIRGIPMRLRCVFSEYYGYMFMVAGMYPERFEKRYGQDIRDCLASFGFAD